jgi:hypothetical protein
MVSDCGVPEALGKGRITGMKRRMQITRVALTVLLGSALLSLALWTPASAQIVPPDRNAVDLRVATFAGASVYSAGLSWGFTPQLDLAASYSFQSIGGGPTGSLLSAGVRYHFPVTTPGVDVYLGAGFANENGPFPGFGTLNASGFSAGGGASIRLTEVLVGYASGSIFSLGGTTNSVIDLGLQLHFTPRISGQLGYINFAGASAPYLGVNINFPGR